MSALPKSRLPKEFKPLPRRFAGGQAQLRTQVVADQAAAEESQDQHQRFVEAVHAAFGMWKGREDIPRDALEYESWVRGKCP